jgi:hypothetical protein
MGDQPQFPFFGAGDATYFEWAEVHVLFARDPSTAEKKSIAAGVPAPLRDSITWKGRHLTVASGQQVHADISRAWPNGKLAREDGCIIAENGQVTRFNEAIDRWLQDAHRVVSIVAAFRHEDLESGGTPLSEWHRWSLKQLARLWTPLRQAIPIASARTMLVGIARFAEAARLKVPKEIVALRPPTANVHASTAKSFGWTQKRALLALVQKAGLGSELTAKIRKDKDEGPIVGGVSEGLIEDVFDVGMAANRSRFLAAAAEVAPKSASLARYAAYFAYMWMNGRQKDAIDLFESLIERRGMPLNGFNNAIAALTLYGRLAVEPARARRFIRAALPYSKENPSIHHNIACAYVLLKDPSSALQQLELAVQRGHEKKLIKEDEVFKPLRAEPRWKALIR